MRKAKLIKYTILIVCEGANTEPNYFQGIKEDITNQRLFHEEGLSININIRPKPPLSEEEEKQTSRHKTPRKKRQLKNVPIEPEVVIEEQHRAVPTRYVREAQLGLEDGTYDEAWAVFDQDRHPRHQEAFALAQTEIEGKYAKIAFSSISFEHWVLLHFERNDTAFQRSECKDPNREVIGCGTGLNPLDCYGNSCVSGYLKINHYLPGYGKQVQFDTYSHVKDKTHIALANASWLRRNTFPDPVYLRNPYTDMDLLVKRLLNISTNYHWADPGDVIEIGEYRLCLSPNPDGSYSLDITNQKTISQILNLTVQILNQNQIISETPLRVGVLAPAQHENRVISINNPENQPFDLIGLEMNQNIVFIPV